MEEVKPGLYEHFKGKKYEVIGVARHSETLEEFVIYKALYESKFGKNILWIRPKEMFQGEKEIDGKKVKRFRYIGEVKEENAIE